MGYVQESAVSQNFRQAETLAIIYKIYVPKSEDKKARHEFSNPWHFINSLV